MENGLLDLEELFRTTVIEVQQLLSADRVCIVRFYRETAWKGDLVAESSKSGWDQLSENNLRSKPFEELVAFQHQRGGVVAISDSSEKLQEHHREALKPFQVHGMIAAPLLKNDALWGLLWVQQSDGPRQWTRYEVELVSQISQRITIALQQSEVLMQARFQAEQQKPCLE